MPWETRNGKGRYYTRSTRVDGKVVRTYIGTGEIAEKIAEGIEYRKSARAAQRAEEGRGVNDVDLITDDFYRQAAAIMRETLEHAGYRQHQRGEWRKRRGPIKGSEVY